MSSYEFQVVPAPVKSRKLTDLSKDQDKFCSTITDVLTDMGLEGWDFMGAETLPNFDRFLFVFPRRGLKTCLIFRREIERAVEPKRVARATAEVTELSEVPVRKSRRNVVEKFKSEARRLRAPVMDETSDAAPLQLDSPSSLLTADDERTLETVSAIMSGRIEEPKTSILPDPIAEPIPAVAPTQVETPASSIASAQTEEPAFESVRPARRAQAKAALSALEQAVAMKGASVQHA